MILFLPSYGYTGDAMNPYIKRCVPIAVIILCCGILLSGCTRSVRSACDELCMARWGARQENGNSLELFFDGSEAFFSAWNSVFNLSVNGVYTADDETFVIFDEVTQMPFHFSYLLHGDSLELTYRGSTVILDKI